MIATDAYMEVGGCLRREHVSQDTEYFLIPTLLRGNAYVPLIWYSFPRTPTGM